MRGLPGERYRSYRGRAIDGATTALMNWRNAAGSTHDLRVAGVPPDYFSKKGQRWGNPVYRWEVLEKEGFRWWIQRLSHVLSLFDMVRIDHFRGLVKFWSIPASERSAVKGKWVEASPDAFFLKVKEKFPRMPLLLEDSGITPEAKEHSLNRHSPTLVLQSLNRDDRKSYAPANHVENACVYTGTHDNNTSRGWFESEAGPEARKYSHPLVAQTSDTLPMEMMLAAAGFRRIRRFPYAGCAGPGERGQAQYSRQKIRELVMEGQGRTDVKCLNRGAGRNVCQVREKGTIRAKRDQVR